MDCICAYVYCVLMRKYGGVLILAILLYYRGIAGTIRNVYMHHDY